MVSYNPGYQSVLKDLKMSTRQRLVGIDLGFPPPELRRRSCSRKAALTPTCSTTSSGWAKRSDVWTTSRCDEPLPRGRLSRLQPWCVSRLASSRAAAVSAIASPLTDVRRHSAVDRVDRLVSLRKATDYLPVVMVCRFSTAGLGFCFARSVAARIK